MRWIALAAVVSFSLPALAQTDESPAKPAVEDIDFGEMYIHGDTSKPKGLMFQGKRRPVFKPLHELKRNFLPRTIATAKDTSLR